MAQLLFPLHLPEQGVSPLKQYTDVKSKSSRQRNVLSENWKFQVDIKDIGEREHWFMKDFNACDWGKVQVPSPWDCYETALWEYEGIGWYMTTISPDDFTNNKRNSILFHRVMYYSKVWLNGEFIGENIGGYLPFDFNITNHLKRGVVNTLVLRVDNKPRPEWLPGAKQIEWIQYGGILDKVELINTAYTYIEDLAIRTTLKKGGALISCMVNVANESDDATEIKLDIAITKKEVIINKTVDIRIKSNKSTTVNIDLTLDNPDGWSPDSPFLYIATATLRKNDEIIDDLTDRFGIRELRVEGTSIMLNDKPVNIKGVNRYDDYGRYGPVVPEKLLREELALMKSVGINFIRMHYPQSPDLLSLYDEYGFMVMEENTMCWWGSKLVWRDDAKFRYSSIR